MDNELNQLRERVRQLEHLELDYHQLRHLIDYAAQNQRLDRYAGDIFLHADPSTGLILDANPLATDLLGYSPEEFLTLTIDSIEVIDGHRESPSKRYIESDIERVIYDCFYRHKDGRLLPIHAHKRLITVLDKPTLHYALEVRSLHKKLWHELNRREDMDYQFREKLKLLNEINVELGVVDSFDELCRLAVTLGIQRLGFERLGLWFLDAENNRMMGTYGVDEDGNIRDERTSGWTFENTPLTDFLTGHKDPIITQDDAPIYNNRSEIIGYGWHISVPLLYHGKFIGYMTADNYLTKQVMKNYEPELLRLYGATIGHLAAHQRDQEAAAKLSDSLHLKQERVGILETFISHVGHDFRTPLTIIGTNTYLLSRSTDPTRKEQIAQNIQHQIMYIDRVINRMLEVIKLESISEMALAPMDMSILLLQTVEPIEILAHDKHITCSVQADTRVSIRVNGEWMARALSEIMENAVQYTDEGGRISIDLLVYDHEVAIRIQDSGMGIDNAHLDKIFNHLYRVDEARTRQGVGLGLTLAKQVVEAHKGRILVESTPGDGSVFTVTLPR